MPDPEAHIDPELCIGSQMCVSVAPEAFKFLLHEGVSTFVGPASDPDELVEAARACPTGAITVRNPATGAQLFPEPQEQ